MTLMKVRRTHCRHKRQNQQHHEAVFVANLAFQILAESQAGTKSLIKPLYANCDYKSGFKVPHVNYDDIASNITLSPFNITTSTFYMETLKEDPENPWTLSLKSPCKLDLAALNQSMHLTVYGRKKQE